MCTNYMLSNNAITYSLGGRVTYSYTQIFGTPHTAKKMKVVCCFFNFWYEPFDLHEQYYSYGSTIKQSMSCLKSRLL